MTYCVYDWERPILRELAVRQAVYAALPVMRERERMWRELNMGRGGNARPPVVIEEWTFDRDFMPQSAYRCGSELGRAIEYRLLSAVRSHELIGDDKVVPSAYRIGWNMNIDEFGVEIPVDYVKDAENVVTGYCYHHPVKDLRKDFHMLKPVSISVDKQGTMEYKAFLEDLFGEALPVEIVCHGGMLMSLTSRVIKLMGMECFFLSMLDDPDGMHALMEYLTQNALVVQTFCEEEGLLTPCNGNHDSFGSSLNFIDELPQKDSTGGPYRLRDMWLSCNSQETVGISPQMYAEFCLPYYSRVCEPAGLIYYGCCEPASPFWDSISRLPHLKKVSISRWCDEGFMGEALRGTPIVYSRKPDPNYLSVDAALNEESWAQHIRKSLRAARGCQMEIIIRDVYTLHGNISNARSAVEIARMEVDRAGY